MEPPLEETIVWAVDSAKFHLENSGQKKVHKELCSRFYKKISKKIKKLEEVYIYLRVCMYMYVCDMYNGLLE